MNIRQRAKADLSTSCSQWMSDEFIPADVRQNLLLTLINSPLTSEQKTSLVAYASELSQVTMNGEIETGKKQREQIEAVAVNARRLLSSLNMLGKPARIALDAHFKYLAVGDKPPVEIDAEIKTQIKQRNASLLSTSWDWTSALEVAANYAADQFNIDKTTKPGQMRARGFVAKLAGQIRELTGVLPPKDPAAWFAGFTECLGDHLDLEIGPRIVKSGIEAAR